MKRLGRILVVDDEENICFVVSKGLTSHGYDARSAQTGAAARSIIDEWDHDVIVLDVMLPDVNGFDFLQQLRVEGVDTPLVF